VGLPSASQASPSKAASSRRTPKLSTLDSRPSTFPLPILLRLARVFQVLHLYLGKEIPVSLVLAEIIEENPGLNLFEVVGLARRRWQLFLRRLLRFGLLRFGLLLLSLLLLLL